MHDSKALIQIPYENLAQRFSEETLERNKFNAKTEFQKEYSQKNKIQSQNQPLTHNEIIFMDRRAKPLYEGKIESENHDSFNKNEVIQTKFNHPRFQETHFSIGSGKRVIPMKSNYEKEFQNFGKISTANTKDLIPKNEVKLPNTYSNCGIKSSYQDQFSRLKLY